MTNETLTEEDKTFILNRVAKALDSQFELYSWAKMIDDCDLTPEQAAWAKEHTSYKLIEIE